MEPDEALRAEWAKSWAGLEAALAEHRAAQERLLQHFAQRPKPPSPPAAPPLESDSSALMDVAAVHGIAAVQPAAPPFNGATPELTDGAAATDMAVATSSVPTGRRREFLKTRETQMAEHFDRLEASAGTPLKRATVRLGYRGWAWWNSVEEPPRTGRVARLISGSAWETLVSLFILLNALFMAMVVDQSITTLTSPESVSLEADRWLFVSETFFLVFFVIELGLRVFVHRLYFFVNREYFWNMFDCIIVTLSVVDAFSQMLPSLPGGWNATFMRCVRVLRLVRSLRVVRVIKYAGALRRMLLSLIGSLVPLFWSLVLLWAVFYLFSLAIVQGVANYLSTSDEWESNPSLAEPMLSRFGSVSQAMLSFYKATCGGTGWGSFFDALAQTTPTTAFVFLAAVSFIQIAVFNIMTGVFVENAFKNAQPDHHSLALEQRRLHMNEAQELIAFFKSADKDGGGTLSLKEFSELCRDPYLSDMLEVMGLDIKDGALLHTMLCEAAGSNEVSIEFLVEALISMKGPAMSLDLLTLSYKADQISRSLSATPRPVLAYTDDILQPTFRRVDM